MTETKKILNIALPAMAENLLQMLMGVVDSYLVAQVGGYCRYIGGFRSQ